MLLAIDPGKRIGYALFDEDGQELVRGVLDFGDYMAGKHLVIEDDTLTLMADKVDQIDEVVIEGFRHDPRIRQGGSLHWASQVEGSVKLLCALTNTPITVQYASVLAVAQIFTGYRPPVTKTGKKKHLPDEDSAFLHGMYYLRNEGTI